uniref:Myomesin-1 n=1 Tax=Latimeria chalumnae TaxID=7897 RepID=H3ASF7_LATCH
MSSGSLPFYQKQHRHYDRAYRSTEVQSALSEYHLQEKRSAASRSLGIHGSSPFNSDSVHPITSVARETSWSNHMSRKAALLTSKYLNFNSGSYILNSALNMGLKIKMRAAQEVLEESSYKLSPRPKRSKYTFSDEKENEIVDYVVPVFRGCHEHISGITNTEEERIKETAGYLARRNLFATGEGVSVAANTIVKSVEEEMFEKKSRKVAVRESAERISLRKKISETGEFHRKLNEDQLLHAPEFVIKPRSHTVWEKQNVKFHCTVSGWPEPHFTWYKNNVPLDVHTSPGKYKIESQYGVHSLEINKPCDFDDTAQYRASAMNIKGELSAYASLVLGYKGEYDETSFHAGTATLPLSFGPSYSYGTKFDIHIVDKFEVSLGREGETLSLGCTVIIFPSTKRLEPEIEWYRNGVLLHPSKWAQMHWSGDRATLTLPHLNKEDEGLYTMRVVTKIGYEKHSAYVFVRDADAEVAGAPAAPLDVECLDANKDYVIVTWKQPSVDGGSNILGYFVDRCEVGTTQWSQCNDTPVKFARFPVTGLVEGRSYIFRVRAVNNSGISRPSRVSEPVAALDPADRARLKGLPSAPWTGQIIVTEEEPAEGVVPGPPSNLAVTEATKNYVVLSWKPPSQRGHEGVMYYVEKCIAGTDNWQRVNTEIPVKSPRFALFDLAEGKSYTFRIRCCNSAGVGEPSEATEPTVVGDKADIPSPPSKIVPSRNTDTSVVINWEESKDAKELVGYYIDASIVGSGKCEPCNNKPVKGNRFVCHGLVTGEKYTFKMRAVNAAGISKYSQESEAIEVKAALGKGLSEVCPEASDKIGGLTESTACWDSEHEAPQRTLATDTLLNFDAKFNRHALPTSSDKPKSTGVSHEKEPGQAKYPPPPQKKKQPNQPTNSSREGPTTPAPPYDITVLESVRDSMVLSWKQPKFHGGAEITGYFVNYREVIADKPGRWQEANIKPISDRAYRVLNLKENMVYQFEVRAVNVAGVGEASKPSKNFKCEEWTIAVPGPPHDLRYSEVRKNSLVLLWNPPVYIGRSEVTGYYVDFKETNAAEEKWKSVNENKTQNKFFKIQGLNEGVSYVFRVRAVNRAGVGKLSDPSEPVVAETRPGTKEMMVDVDDDGVISLIYECAEMSADSKFIWSKNYEEITDTSRLSTETKGGRTRLVFKDPAIEDLGIYSCVVTETDGISSSYTIDEKELNRLLQVSYDHKFPIIPLKSELAVEILEKGQLRFWLQAEKLSPNVKAQYVFNDKEVFHGENYQLFILLMTKVPQFLSDYWGDRKDTFLLFARQDGKAASQSSLVLIGDVFRKLQNEAEFQRQEWFRKQGPHFVEYLGWEVTSECNVLLKCKVANIKKETNIVWYKDEREIMVDEKHDFKDGVCTLLISEISKKDAGVYLVILKDERGKDKSTLKLVEKGNKMHGLSTETCQKISLHSSEHKQKKKKKSTQGFIMYCLFKFPLTKPNIGNQYHKSVLIYAHKLKELKYTKTKTISTRKEKSNQQTLNNYVQKKEDRSASPEPKPGCRGNAYDEAYAEFQRLKQAAIAERNRARVTGGLPDVVTIQEGKSLNLTCNIWGDPVPEVSWQKNERMIVSDDRYVLKFESGKYANFTINKVTMTDSGKYSIVVKNKYGTETGDFTVSVFLPEGEDEIEPEPKTADKKKKK